jgi:ribonuclease J
VASSDVVLRVLDGEDTIGGAKILVGWGGEGIFLDFGINYGKFGRYFEEYLQPRTSVGLGDLWRLGLVPQVRSLYRPDVVPAGLLNEQQLPIKTINGVYLSHAHLDHAGLIGLLDYPIPLVTSRTSAAILKGIQDSKPQNIFSQSVYSTPFTVNKIANQEVMVTDSKRAFVGRSVHLTDGTGEDGFSRFWQELPSVAEKDGRKSKTKELEPGDVRMHQASAGGVHAKPFHVDHSIMGSGAYLIETPQGPIVYSGDIRTHGGRGDSTTAFLRQLEAKPPWILLMEGTQLRPPRPGQEPHAIATEADVERNSLEAVMDYQGKLVVADFGPRNIERLFSFLRIAKQTGRRLAIVPKDAYLLYSMNKADPTVPLPHEDMLVFDPPTGARPAKWEEFILQEFAPFVLHHHQVRARQAEIILCFSFWDMKHLLDIAPEPGGCYIYSSSEAHNEEQAIDMRRLYNWITLFGLHPIGFKLVKDADGTLRPRNVPGFHASGHMPGNDILEWVRRIRPEMLLPVHTEHAEQFDKALDGTGTKVLKGGL